MRGGRPSGKLCNRKGLLTCVTGCYREEGGIKKVLILCYIIFEEPPKENYMINAMPCGGGVH